MPEIGGLGNVGGPASPTHLNQTPDSKPAEAKANAPKAKEAGGVLGGLSGMKKPAASPNEGTDASKLNGASATPGSGVTTGARRTPPPPRTAGRTLPPPPTARMPKPGEMAGMGQMPDMMSQLQASGAMQAQQLHMMQAAAFQNAELQMKAGQIHQSETMVSALTSIMNKGVDNIAKAAKGE